MFVLSVAEKLWKEGNKTTYGEKLGEMKQVSFDSSLRVCDNFAFQKTVERTVEDMKPFT
jgi:hypothetical protein